MSKPLRIISAPVDDGGCGWYRIRQPFEMIQRFSEHDTHIMDGAKDDSVALTKAMTVTDVVVLRPGAEVMMRKMRNTPEFRHIKWVMDIDDNVEIISPYSNHYEEYGTKEFKHGDKFLWKDGENKFDLEENKQRVASLTAGLSEVDLVTVTTRNLAKYAKKYNKSVSILPNCINIENWWKVDTKPNKRLRVGWSGGSSHYEDWFSIKEPLNKLMREKQFELWMIGHSFPGVIDKENQHLLRTMPWVPFKGHSFRMMCAALDIAIVPLADLPFNHYKSSIKFYEMSALGVPSVVSNTLPYSEDINDKIALPYHSTDGFEMSLTMLLENAELRKKIGKSARKWVVTNRNAEKSVDLWIEAYRSILT